MKREVVVSSVAFSEEGLNLEWMILPDDVRSQARVVSSRSTAISFDTAGGLGEAATDLRTAVDALGLQLLQQLEAGILPVYEEPPQTDALGYQRITVEDEDDDVGMGEGR